jgi:uncharacterized membrane protein
MLAMNREIEMRSVAEEGQLSSGRAPLDPDLIYPHNRGERINLMIHFHRAEIARMAGWRDRIDRTTNWAITVVAASLSYSFSSPSVSHATLIACMVMVSVLLVIEARRYRFFDVFRCRVRLLEKNYYAGLMSLDPRPDETWLKQLGEDLRHPTFKITLSDAIKRRLRRNYIWLLAIVWCAWILKICTAGPSIRLDTSVRLSQFLELASIGEVPGSIIVSIIVVGYVTLIVFMRLPGRSMEHLPKGGVNV